MTSEEVEGLPFAIAIPKDQEPAVENKDFPMEFINFVLQENIKLKKQVQDLTAEIIDIQGYTKESLKTLISDWYKEVDLCIQVMKNRSNAHWHYLVLPDKFEDVEWYEVMKEIKEVAGTNYLVDYKEINHTCAVVKFSWQ